MDLWSRSIVFEVVSRSTLTIHKMNDGWFPRFESVDTASEWTDKPLFKTSFFSLNSKPIGLLAVTRYPTLVAGSSLETGSGLHTQMSTLTITHTECR